MSALNKHIQSLEKQLDEKQIIIETLLQNIQNCSYNNIVANSNHKADKVSFENLSSPHEKSKMTTTIRIITTIRRQLAKRKMNNP